MPLNLLKIISTFLLIILLFLKPSFPGINSLSLQEKELFNYEEFENKIKMINSTFQNLLVKAIGKTFQNKTIYSIIASKNIKQELQSAKKKFTILICARQHGDEPAGTKALLEYIPRLNSLNFLENLTILMIPWANPEGEALKKYNALNIDINDDHISLKSNEAKSIHSLYNNWRVGVFIDLHETIAIKEDLAYLWPTNEFVPHLIINASKSLAEAMANYINYKGYSTTIWKGIPDLITTARNYFAIRGSLSILIETNLKNEFKKRVEIQSLCINFILDYVSKNLEKIKHVIENAKETYVKERKIWGFVFYTNNLNDLSFLLLHGLEIYKSSNWFNSIALSYKRIKNQVLIYEDIFIFYPSTLIIPNKGNNVPIALVIFNNWKESLKSNLSESAEFYILNSSPRVILYDLVDEEKIELRKPTPFFKLFSYILTFFLITLFIMIIIFIKERSSVYTHIHINKITIIKKHKNLLMHYF